MKLYKGDRVMQFVDKDQVEACLEAGWVKESPEVEIPEVEEQEEETNVKAPSTKTVKIVKTPKKKK
ncbi:MAG: hypothetical protein GY861_14315 [bacterium]|nr:hypothetical protein [bacterium]